MSKDPIKVHPVKELEAPLKLDLKAAVEQAIDAATASS